MLMKPLNYVQVDVPTLFHGDRKKMHHWEALLGDEEMIFCAWGWGNDFLCTFHIFWEVWKPLRNFWARFLLKVFICSSSSSESQARRICSTYRSVQLKEEIAGILLNPNCRYEANFVPFHTMAEWNSCQADAEVEEGICSSFHLTSESIVFQSTLRVCHFRIP